jgi:class 3 adenylate cyclase
MRRPRSVGRGHEHRQLEAEQQRSDKLLLNVLPASIAERLKESPGLIADSYTEATVLFADIVGFTELSERKTAHDVVHLLNQVFSRFDDFADHHGLEKIKTIGDAYMVAAGAWWLRALPSRARTTLTPSPRWRSTSSRRSAEVPARRVST